MQSWRPLKTCTALLIAVLGSGCVGGPVAQQIASSVATRVADKVVGDIVDARLAREREPTNIVLKDTEPDPYYAKFLLMQFPDAPQPQVVIEPLPTHTALEDGTAAYPSSRLVTLEVVNLIIGSEKYELLERSLRNGSNVVPAQTEWRDWQIAMGSPQEHAEAQLYFLVPPDFGRILSGESAVVEIAQVGGLHIARYRAN